MENQLYLYSSCIITSTLYGLSLSFYIFTSSDKIFDNPENNVIIEYDKYYKLYNGNEKKVVQKLSEIFGLKYLEGDM